MEPRLAVRRLTDNPVVSGFRDFLVKQNIIALALAVVVGAALNGLVKAVVDDFIMPVIGYAVPAGDWQKATWNIGPVKFGVGNFASAFINFLIIALVAWRIAKAFVKTVVPPPTKTCEFCRMAINPAATRCPHCTSQLAA
jgi:large conductance mechanosensitive channel